MSIIYDFKDLRVLLGPCTICGHEEVCATGRSGKCLKCGTQYAFGITVEVKNLAETMSEMAPKGGS